MKTLRKVFLTVLTFLGGAFLLAILLSVLEVPWPETPILAITCAAALAVATCLVLRAGSPMACLSGGAELW